MILFLAGLLLVLILLSLLWLHSAKPTAREIRLGLITLGTTAGVIIGLMVVLAPSASW